MHNTDLKLITYLHTIRIPVELALYGVFVNGLIPELMTFEGRNFDILSGITAPLVAFFSFRNNRINYKLLLYWNIFALILLANILINAVLSVPTVLQQFAFDQPNIGVLHFPFILLPAVIVPIVLFSQVAMLKQIIIKLKN